MNIRRLQGWALLISAALDLVGLLGSDALFFRVLLLAGAVLFMFGIPVIQSVQPAGAIGWVGIILLELGALIALILTLIGFSANSLFDPAIPLVSAFAGGLGRIIVGWLTTRRTVFAPWVGWAFILEGLLNVINGVARVPLAASAVGVVVPLAGALALFGYGWSIIRESGMMASGAE